MTYTYQWERCDTAGNNPVPIPGATSQTYLLVSADVGSTIRVIVTRNDGVTETSGQTTVIGAVPPPTPPPGAAAAWPYPWMSPNGPWRKQLPANVPIHPLSPGMVQSVYVGYNFDSDGDMHAWAYADTEMQAKWANRGAGATAGLTFMKWAGPGGIENVIYSPNGQTLTKVWIDFPSLKSSSAMVPFPSNWTGFNTPIGPTSTQYIERRTVVVCQSGDIWVMYQPTPPGFLPHNGGPADSDWHATTARIIGNIADETWDYHGGGGSGIPHGCGLITPFDVAYAQVNGDFGHTIAVNTNNAADGTFTGIPMGVWPALKGYAGAPDGPTGDGKTKTNAGIPHGARVMLDPSLSDANLTALGLTKTWQFWFAHTFQKYGAISKESTTGQGGAGGFMTETIESIAWNIAHGYYPGGFQYPWIADGTMNNVDIDGSVYNAAFPQSLMPRASSHWRVVDYTKAIPGINSP